MISATDCEEIVRGFRKKWLRGELPPVITVTQEELDALRDYARCDTNFVPPAETADLLFRGTPVRVK